MSRVIVIGGGASGMMAAIVAADNGHQVTLLEKNEKLGKKLFITGKGRCNLTNACDAETFFDHIMSGKKFMYSAFYGFSNDETIGWFEAHGLKTKIERGERVFPTSDHSSDVIKALETTMRRSDPAVKIRLQAVVEKILFDQEKITGVLLKDRTRLEADAVIIATGGCSYPACGSTGDGYRFAVSAGHKVTDRQPALVPLVIEEKWIQELQGLSLKNVAVCISKNHKKRYEGFGEMLFTHYGVSGPLILSASSHITQEMYGDGLKLSIDLKPALSEQQLDERVQRDFMENQNRQFKNALNKLLPAKLIPVVIQMSGIGEDRQINGITHEERGRLVHILKHLEMTVTGTRGFEEAIITRGGISLKEINPATMESKIVKGLYFIGEVLDIDALTGGFNLQIAWSTAYAAGNSII
ncbi:MAG: NAD(P)/FAD-dependent oxidoreductase [bacterium]|nr:NAD(P)/FAD-dependent oxidoreductase [bacterium]